MLGNREDAEEVLQDAFVRAYRSLACCDDPERFGAWLYGILVNRCRTAGARAARRARRVVPDPAALETAPLAGPARGGPGGEPGPRGLAGLPPRGAWEV